MQNYRECFEKVRKDCLKYIQSQETKKEKFKNKDQMEDCQGYELIQTLY